MPGVLNHDKVAFLSSASAYGAPCVVEVIETHFAWVFLAGDRVYKLKKAVRYPWLDYSTVEAREASCREEVRLNRRLAPDVYLGVVPLVFRVDGTLDFGENGGYAGRARDGEVVDWLVEMRRLPAHKMLDEAIKDGRATKADIRSVAAVLARFYVAAEPAQLTAEAYVSQFQREQAKNRDSLTDPRFDLPERAVAEVLTRIESVLSTDTDLLAARVHGGHVVEGHGDLRPEHVCLEEAIVIIDCLEFERQLRLTDPFDELCFLSMECKHLGADWVEPILIEECERLLNDHPSDRLLGFYTTYRACLRTRLALAHLDDEDVQEPEKWPRLAKSYLALAVEASARIAPR